jgi:hypothetical protein
MLASSKIDIDTIHMEFLNNIELFELDEAEVPDIEGWTPEEIGPTLNFDEMNEEAYNQYHTEVPLSPEAEEMLAAITVGSQVEKINSKINELILQRDELLYIDDRGEYFDLFENC